MQTILSVALPTPLRRHFDYLAPLPDLLNTESPPIKVGARVRVPFGRQTLIGVVLAVTSADARSHDAFDIGKLKPIESLLDPDGLLPNELIKLCSWAANYYQHPLGDVFNTALPSGLRLGAPAELTLEAHWQLTTQGAEATVEQLKRAPQQAKALALLQNASGDTCLPQPESNFKQLGATRATLQKLAEKQFVKSLQLQPQVMRSGDLLKQAHLPLNPEQDHALKAMNLKEFGTHLLYGATGSGKTEVYLQAIEEVLARGQRALVLIPEIGLTPQTLQRFADRFNRPLALLHSGLSDGERTQNWIKSIHGHLDIIIGTRSAIFTPIPDLGIIIIDEEHDLSFKQQEGFRYSARDLAAVRAQNLGIPLLLGSATPALESLHNANQNRYQTHRLPTRAGGAQAPQVDLIDIKQMKLTEGMAPQALEAIAATLEHGNQALVFINRRGFAPTMMCHDCGWIAQCPHCDARLTVHQHPRHLHCHHCDYQHPLINRCLQCHSIELQCLGQGSERTESFLQTQFPENDVIRVDRDSTRKKNAMQEIVEQVHQGKPCILVGTQMLAKGHHFPNVTLVVILDADSGLFSADFRGPERMGQLLLQVAGRAGRADKPGRVLIQSHLCDHPLLNTLLQQGYSTFAQLILQERELGQMPPYRYLALLRAESESAHQAMDFLLDARRIAETLQPSNPQIQYLGPLPAPMEKRNQRFRFQLQINASNRARLHQLLQPLIAELDKQTSGRKLRWSIDVDPQDMN